MKDNLAVSIIYSYLPFLVFSNGIKVLAARSIPKTLTLNMVSHWELSCCSIFPFKHTPAVLITAHRPIKELRKLFVSLLISVHYVLTTCIYIFIYLFPDKFFLLIYPSTYSIHHSFRIRFFFWLLVLTLLWFRLTVFERAFIRYDVTFVYTALFTRKCTSYSTPEHNHTGQRNLRECTIICSPFSR